MIGLRDSLGAVRKKFKEHVKILEEAKQKEKEKKLPTPGRQKWAFVKKITKKGKFKKQIGAIKSPKVDKDQDQDQNSQTNRPNKGN